MPPPAQSPRRGRWLWPASVLVLALLPSAGTLSAPWIAEDAAILARVSEDGWLPDWTRSQYGLEIVRFWRPLVSASWGLQSAWTGIDPFALRLFNLACHAGAALLAGALVRRLGGGRVGACLAGAFVALFPQQGGTVTWLAGRTDLLVGVLMLASLWTALGPRPLVSLPLAFLACAAKEFGFLVPLWVLAFARGRGDPPREALLRAVPAALGVGTAFAWRAAALGTLVGGYPRVGSAPPAAASGALAATGRTLWPSLASVLALAWLGRRSGMALPRGIAAALASAALACLPLFSQLADGTLEPENRRLYYVAELGLALAAGLALARPPSSTRARGLLPGLVALALMGRFVLAWRDTHEWAHSARVGEEHVSAARAAVAGASPGSAPVLFAGFPRSVGGAYCLGFGEAERFRAPFPASRRPVWPWRPMFGWQSSARQPSIAVRGDGSLWPLDDASRLPRLTLGLEGGAEVGTLFLDERALRAEDDRSTRLVIVGAPGAPLELVLHTEVGYEPAAAGALDAEGRGTLSLMQLLDLSVTDGGKSPIANLAQALAHASDLGATRAFIELRVLGPDGRRGEVLAASRWIELRWDPALAGRAQRSASVPR